MTICGICGISEEIRSYISLQENCFEIPSLCYILSNELFGSFPLLKDVCAICLEKVNILVKSITDMRKKYILTQVLIDYYYDNCTDFTWLEFKKSTQAKNLETSDIVTEKLKQIKNIPLNTITENVTKIQENGSKLKDKECSDIEWLSDIDNNLNKNISEISNNIEDSTVEISEDINFYIENDNHIHNDLENEEVNISDFTYKPNESQPSELEQIGNSVCNIRVNKRGHWYYTTSHEHVIKTTNGEYVCKMCKLSFKWRHKAEHHIRSEHTQEKPFQCEICDKSFTASHYLKRHVTCVHEKPKFICEKCGQSFNRRYNLTSHEKIHDGAPSITCVYKNCNKKFHSDLVLKAHLVRSHAKKQHICDVCGQYFRNNWHLKGHYRSHIKNK